VYLLSFVTPSGTKKFFERAISKGIKPTHFKKFEELFISGLGMGTYLGAIDDQTDKLVESAVIESVMSGVINVIDTAINYRYQRAERSVGRALRRLFKKGFSRDEIFISTKNGYLTGDGDLGEDVFEHVKRTLIDPGVISVNDIVAGIHCMTPAFLENQLNRSLENLGLKTIDLMYLHNAVESQQPVVGKKEFLIRLKDAFEFFEKARSDGKIKYYGMATWDCFRVTEYEKHHFNLETAVKIAQEIAGESHGFKFVQLPFNLALREALVKPTQTVNGKKCTLLQAAKALGIGVFASVPLLQSNLLKYHLPEIDGRSGALLCLDFVRSTPGILAPLVGHKQPEHVKENLKLGFLETLTETQYKEVMQFSGF